MNYWENLDHSDLHSILITSWKALASATDNSNGFIRTGALATVAIEGPDIRTVILRTASFEERSLICYSHDLALKIRQIELHPRVQWLFFDPVAKVQLKLKGEAEVHTRNTISSTHWQSVPVASRLHYCVAKLPGTFLDCPGSALPESLRKADVSLPETEFGFNHFSVIQTTVDSLEWMQITNGGPIKATFSWNMHKWEANWIVP